MALLTGDHESIHRPYNGGVWGDSKAGTTFSQSVKDKDGKQVTVSVTVQPGEEFSEANERLD
jgi:hypothetical protein